MTQSKSSLLKILYSAICLALCIVLPFLTGHIADRPGAVADANSRAACGFLCGPIWGAIVGAVGPVLRSAIVGMPPMFPYAVSMAFELAAYGALAGILYRLLPKKYPYIYVSLLSSMIIWRLVGGIAKFTILGFDTEKMTLAVFFADYFAGRLPVLSFT